MESWPRRPAGRRNPSQNSARRASSRGRWGPTSRKRLSLTTRSRWSRSVGPRWGRPPSAPAWRPHCIRTSSAGYETKVTSTSCSSSSDPETVGFALDTAELTIAGIDPVKFYEKHHGRVNHVHFKDAATTDTLDEYKDLNAEIEYWPMHLCAAGAKRGIERWYYEMGTPGGRSSFPSLKQALTTHGFDGYGGRRKRPESPRRRERHAERLVPETGSLAGGRSWLSRDRRPRA